MEYEDKFSRLPDDVLLYILDKANTITAIRASFLSTRWRHLPACLPHVKLDIWDFIPVYTSVNQISLHEAILVLDEAMSAMAKASRICFAAPWRENTMKTVSLHLCLTRTARYLHDIGELVWKAIDKNKMTSVELTILTMKHIMDCELADMLPLKKKLLRFFDHVPNLFRCLTKLCLQHIRFDDLEMHRFLNGCQQLQHLVLEDCDTGCTSILKIDMPDSQISYLKLSDCRFAKVDFVCLPKLAEFHYESWASLSVPFSFGYVPCLENVCLANPARRVQPELYVSDLLRGTTAVHDLTLDFQGEKIWMKPEGKMMLYSSFNKLTKMSIRGIHVKFGFSWTIGLLESAPSLKTFCIEVWDHVCDFGKKYRMDYSERTNSWEQKDKLNGFRHSQLTRFEFGGFVTIKKHMHFIRAVIGYAPNLEMILLEDKGPCTSCDRANEKLGRSSTGSVFPKSKFKQGIIRNRLGVGGSCSLQFVFK